MTRQSDDRCSQEAEIIPFSPACDLGWRALSSPPQYRQTGFGIGAVLRSLAIGAMSVLIFPVVLGACMAWLALVGLVTAAIALGHPLRHGLFSSATGPALRTLR